MPDRAFGDRQAAIDRDAGATALLADAVLLTVSATILRGLRVREHVEPVRHPFWPAMRDGLAFVRGNDVWLLDLEREAFLSLCGEPKSQERMQYMLMNNKPLRN